MRPALFLLCILSAYNLSGATSAFAQGMYFEKGESGFAFGAGYLSDGQSDGWLLQTGYSFRGEYDLGVMLSNPVQPQGIGVMSIMPFIGVHMFKENDRMPVSFLFSMAYEYYVYMGESMGLAEDAMHGSAFTVAGRVYKTIPYYGSHYLIPYCGIGLITRSIEGPHLLRDNNDTVIEVGLDAVFRLTSRIGIAPGINVAFTDEEHAFGISANLFDRGR
jgi:hypothetical protein